MCQNHKTSFYTSYKLIFTHSVVLLALMALCLVAAPSYATTAESTKAMVSRSMMKTPMLFERNIGQAHEDIDFISRGFGYSVGLSEGGVASIRLNRASDSSTKYLRIRPVGATGSRASGAEKHQAKFNYYKGSDRSKWVTGAESYRKVRYGDIYPGVDLVYYGNQKRLEYDFVVAPGADPDVIGLSFEGSRSVSIDEDGDLVLGFADGEVLFQAPVTYQEKDGKRVEVASEYVVGKDDRVSFRVSDYDKTASLIIDPILTFSTLIGGGATDESHAITVDSSGNVWITGRTANDTIAPIVNFPITNGLPHNGGYDIFVTKLSPAGVILFSTYVGGLKEDFSRAIVLDNFGNIWITGQTQSANYPVTNGSTHQGGNYDAFVTKLNSSGVVTVSTLLGGGNWDISRSIALDGSGNVWITGNTLSTNYPVTDGSTNKGSHDVFVTKLRPSDGFRLFSTFIGGGSNEFGNSIAVSSAGAVWVTGQTRKDEVVPIVNFPVTDGSTHKGEHDVFVMKFNLAGAKLFATIIGGQNNDRGNDITVDGAGNVWVTGGTNIDLSPPIVNYPVTDGSTHNGGSDVFVTKLNNAGAVLFSTMFGGGSEDSSNAIALDSIGNIWLTGSSHADTFPPIVKFPTTDGSSHKGDTNDVFVAKLSAAGTMTYSSLFGGESHDVGRGIAIDGAGNPWITGTSLEDIIAPIVNFPTTDGSMHKGSNDAFVTKLSRPRFADFNNDGRSDILRKYKPDGRTLVWTMFGSTVASAQWTTQFLNTNWKIVGIRDFNKDGKADILWRYKPDGRTLIWFMEGKTVLGAQWTSQFFNNSWQVAQVGDFNRDGRADILWRYKPTGRPLVWTMFGSTVVSILWVSQNFNNNWKVIGVGDFNSDEKMDILWRYKPDGRTLISFMSGNIVLASQWTSKFFNLNWEVAGIADFNRDGRSDLFWRYKPDGRTLVRFMYGSTVIATQWTSQFFNINWSVARLGDYNGDGKSDVLWLYKPDGRTLVRFMSGSTVIATQWTSIQYNTNWTVE